MWRRERGQRKPDSPKSAQLQLARKARVSQERALVPQEHALTQMQLAGTARVPRERAFCPPNEQYLRKHNKSGIRKTYHSLCTTPSPNSPGWMAMSVALIKYQMIGARVLTAPDLVFPQSGRLLRRRETGPAPCSRIRAARKQDRNHKRSRRPPGHASFHP